MIGKETISEIGFPSLPGEFGPTWLLSLLLLLLSIGYFNDMFRSFLVCMIKIVKLPKYVVVHFLEF